MPPLRNIAFLLDDFGGPSQQLLDRFLIGYPRDGALHKPEATKISAYLAVSQEANFDRRPEELRLIVPPTAEQAVSDADAVVIVSRRPGTATNEAFMHIALERAPQGAACFVHGVIANTLASAQKFAAIAAQRRIALLAATPPAVTWRLPQVELPPGARLTDALIVVQVNPLAIQATPPAPPATLHGAELQALDGLLPVIERRRGGESGIRSVRYLEGKSLWRAGEKGLWSRPLLAAALSRSDTPQGGALLDGRTQDLAGLGMVPKLARHPRGWLLEHRDGLRSAILVLDGVVADSNFAVRSDKGDIVSAQLFHAPSPGERHFDRLAAVMEDFFRKNEPPWPLQRNLLTAGLLEIFAKPSSLSGAPIETPELSIAYSPQ